MSRRAAALRASSVGSAARSPAIHANTSIQSHPTEITPGPRRGLTSPAAVARNAARILRQPLAGSLVGSVDDVERRPAPSRRTGLVDRRPRWRFSRTWPRARPVRGSRRTARHTDRRPVARGFGRDFPAGPPRLDSTIRPSGLVGASRPGGWRLRCDEALIRAYLARRSPRSSSRRRWRRADRASALPLVFSRSCRGNTRSLTHLRQRHRVAVIAAEPQAVAWPQSTSE